MRSTAKFATVCGILSLCLVGSALRAEEKNPADQASERVPDESIRGTTSDKGPQKYGVKEEKTERPVKAESVEEPKRKERVVEERVVVSPKEERVVVSPKESSEVGKIPEPRPTTTVEPAAPTNDDLRKEREASRKRLETEVNIRAAIRRLCTSGWREAQLQLIDSGKTAMPFLIEALGNTEDDGTPAPAAYQLGGHTKSDLGRAPRQRTRAEVCTELLTEIVSHHSNFKGDVPTNDQKAWQEWWVANGEKISFAK